MNDQSPDLDLSPLADATRGSISRRTILAGTAFAVPAVALTIGTPASAASTDWDLTISYAAIDVGSPKNGLPGHNAGSSPYIDVTVYNAGQGPSPQTTVQLDFDEKYVSGVTPYPGWTETQKFNAGGRLSSIMTYSGGGLAGGASAAARFVFQIRTDAPSGSNEQYIGVVARPTEGDINPSNNSTQKKFYVTQSTQHDFAFTYFALQVTGVYNGRPLYGAGNRPFLDLSIQNNGGVASPSTAVQLDFDTNYVKDVTPPSGWTVTSSAVNGGWLQTVMAYSGGGLASNASLSGRFLFTVREESPYGGTGVNQNTVKATALPTHSDADTANNTTSATFYVQQQVHDLVFSYNEVQSDGVPIYGGRPVYGPNNGPFIDLEMYNDGPAAIGDGSIYMDFPAAQVSSAYAPSGWTKIADYLDTNTNVRAFRFRYNGIIAAKGRAGGRFFFSIVSSPPAGYTLATVHLTAEPGPGDRDFNNNQTTNTFYTLR